jgi:hypothetical protein
LFEEYETDSSSAENADNCGHEQAQFPSQNGGVATRLSADTGRIKTKVATTKQKTVRGGFLLPRTVD